MPEQYAPRTVAIVALISLVVGFVLVFGGGLIVLRPRSRDSSPAEVAPRSTAPARASTPEGTPAANTGGGARAATESATSNGAGPATVPSGDQAAEPAVASPQGAPAAEPVSASGITIGPSSTSRCFNQGAPTQLPSAQCDRLAALDQHITSKAADIAACARSGAHGRLSLILDFRFSTSFLRGWGSPTSTVPNAGTVTACVKRVISPLPFGNIPHQHDRYLVVVPIDW